MRAFFISILLFSICLVSAQDGYKLNFKINKSSIDSIDLAIYSGTYKKFYEVESQAVDKKTTFNEPKKIISAIYRVQYNGASDKDYINIAVDNGADLNFEIRGNDIRTLSTSDPLNQLFIRAQNARTISERDIIFNKIVEKYPNSVAALFAKLELKDDQPLPGIQYQDSLKAIQTHYFDGIDLNDKRIPLLPNLYSSLFHYIQIMPINNANYQAAIDRLFKGQDCDSPNYMTYLKWTFMNLDYLSRFNLYDSYVYVFNTYMNQGKCIAKNQDYYSGVVKDLQNYEKVPLGSVIPNFEMVDAKGNRNFISEIYPKHEYTFIAFYDPDCSHCQKEIPVINTYFNELKSNSNIDIEQVAFLNAVSDYKWQTFIKENNLRNWRHVKSDDPNLKYIRALDVFANPAFFLVNRKGEIMMKNYNPNEMTKIFQSN